MKKILVVEDDLFLGKYYCTLLKKAGYEAQHLPSGHGVVEKIRNEKPDVLMLDILMTGKDGFEVLKELAAENLLYGTIILVLTQLEMTEDMDKIKALGVEHMMWKNKTSFKEVLAWIKTKI